MKKHYILFFLFSWVSFYGQTYNFNINSGIICNICWEEGSTPGQTYNSFTATNYYYLIKYNNTTIATENTNYVSYRNSVPHFSVTIPNGSLFSVSMTSKGSAHYEGSSGPCNTNDPPKTMTLENLIISGSLGFYQSCGLDANINSFKPNITIKNVDPVDPNTVCAGATVSLNAFSTNGGTFPNVAYHWQYSLGNDIWNDFPAAIANNTPAPIFSMQQLLGASHEFYFNKFVYFRVGYPGRAFSNVLSVTYSSCAPVITAINYVGPKCYGDKVQKVDITFDRELKSNEGLYLIAMVNVQNNQIRNQRSDVEIAQFASPNVYSYTNLENDLEPGKTYKITYQAKINNPADPTKPFVMGTMESKASQNFTYNPPTPLKFDITDKKNPSCVGGNDGFVEITVATGTAPYNFYIDNTAVSATYNSATNKYYIYGLKDKTYNIMVTDKNDCIDKTANDI